MVPHMPGHRRGVQLSTATGLGAKNSKLSFCHGVFRCIWMFLSTVIQQILFAEISSPSDPTATWNITRKNAFVVLVTHMFRVRGLGIEGLILSLRLSRKLLECLVAVLGTFMM